MIIAGRIAGLLVLVVIGSYVGRHYQMGEPWIWLSRLWLPISAVSASGIALIGAKPVRKALTRYESLPPSISGERLMIGAIGAVIACLASNFWLLVGILTG